MPASEWRVGKKVWGLADGKFRAVRGRKQHNSDKHGHRRRLEGPDFVFN